MTITIVKQTDSGHFALINRDGTLSIDIPDGEGGWFTVVDDGHDLAGDFDTHVDIIEEELRVLMGEAMTEFGY